MFIRTHYLIHLTLSAFLISCGGGKEFQPTIPNTIKPGKIPEGMVFIPGREFSMGGIDPVGMNDGGNEKMMDARPIHRVYVDPFFMDETEVTGANHLGFTCLKNN